MTGVQTCALPICGDIKAYRELYENIPEYGKSIEIGCFFGRSIASVSDIIIRKKIKVYIVDLFNVKEWNSHKVKLDIASHYDEFINILKFYKINKNVCAFCMSSLDSHIFFNDNDFDLIFLDSQHTYEHLSNEIKLYKNKLKPNGVLCGHDFYKNSEVEKVINEKFTSYIVKENSSIWVGV